MSRLWQMFCWYVLGMHSRWGVRYTFPNGYAATPDFYTEKEARERFNLAVDCDGGALHVDAYGNPQEPFEVELIDDAPGARP